MISDWGWGPSHWDKKEQEAGKACQRLTPCSSERSLGSAVPSTHSSETGQSLLVFLLEMPNWNNPSLEARNPKFPNESVLDLCVLCKQKTSVTYQELLAWSIYFGGKWRHFSKYIQECHGYFKFLKLTFFCPLLFSFSLSIPPSPPPSFSSPFFFYYSLSNNLKNCYFWF